MLRYQSVEHYYLKTGNRKRKFSYREKLSDSEAKYLKDST